MAKYLIIIEDADPSSQDAPLSIQTHQFLSVGDDPKDMTRAGKLARFLEMKICEMELAAEQDRKQAEGQRGEEAARCWH
jgi:hypothetical protein